MARRLDQILVIDIESTCWEGAPPAGEESEIIEIGICPLDIKSGERLEKRSILVKPERSRISAFCTELTTLTAEQVAEGIGFRKACEILKKEYRSRDRTWASYGDYDRRQFERQCAATGVDYPFGATHLNVKNLFSLMMGISREVGMAEAMERLERPIEGTHHRGDDDAWNIAGILGELLMRGRNGHGG